MLRLYRWGREDSLVPCTGPGHLCLLQSLTCQPAQLPVIPATSTAQPLTSSSDVQGRDSELPSRTEWPLASDVDDRRRLRAPLQLLGMLKAQRLW